MVFRVCARVMLLVVASKFADICRGVGKNVAKRAGARYLPGKEPVLGISLKEATRIE